MALGIGEVWRSDGEELRFHLRDEAGSFTRSPRSRCFPWRPLAPSVEHLRAAGKTDETSQIKSFRARLREALGGSR